LTSARPRNRPPIPLPYPSHPLLLSKQRHRITRPQTWQSLHP
jgi:hypothetical protein